MIRQDDPSAVAHNTAETRRLTAAYVPFSDALRVILVVLL